MIISREANTLTDEQTTTLAAALAYARRGWAVLPLWGIQDHHCACGDPQCPSPGKHPLGKLVPHGLAHATTDDTIIRRWWSECPNANVAILTGRASGLWVLDVDMRTQGDLTLEELVSAHGPLPLTPHSLTGGGGDHYLFRYPSSGPEIGNLKLAQGLDVKGDAGYIVAPPSIHVTGFPYAWEVSEHFQDLEPAEAPSWLLDLIRSRTGDRPAPAPGELEVWELDTPPVPLPDWGLALWTGERAVDAEDGEEKPAGECHRVDRSETLFAIGRALKGAGADAPTIAAALANRDRTLGFYKYSERRDGYSALEYNRIATKVLSHWEPVGAPKLRTKADTDEEDSPTHQLPDPTERWTIVPASAIDPNDEKITWLWEGYLAAGAITELVGLWKSGKTTLLCHLVKAMETGGIFCGTPLSRCKVLVITEEHSSLWAERRDDLGLHDNVWFMFRPFLGKPTLQQWRQFLRYVAQLVTAHEFDVVILDPLTSQAPIDDENDAGQMTTVIVEFRHIVEAGAALLISHHPSKASQGQGRSSRGSGALPGFVDILLEFRRYSPEQAQDSRRVLLGLSRYRVTPHEAVIELTDTGYVTTGTIAATQANDRYEVIMSLLSHIPVTCDAIAQSWPPDSPVPQPSRSSLYADLAALTAANRILVTGTGRKGDPFRYYLADSSIRPDSSREAG